MASPLAPAATDTADHPASVEPEPTSRRTAPGRHELLAAWLAIPADRGRALRVLKAWAERPESERLLPGADGSAPEISCALFVIGVAELRWARTPWRDVGPLMAHVDAALQLIRRHGDRDHDGLVECGATLVAIAEVQGYVYAAYRARAALARELSDGDAASCWDDAAAAVRFHFHDAFWDAGSGTFAGALDAQKRPLPGVATGLAHCLWAGIVEPARAAAAVAQLVSQGVGGARGPDDDAVLAAGLLRYGFVEEARRVMDDRAVAVRWPR